MHARLRKRLPLDAIELCPHRQDAGCRCRKPRSGMLRSAANRLGIDLRKSFMVGDRRSDIIAGRRAGCRTIWINRKYKEEAPRGADAEVRSLAEAVSVIMRRSTLDGRVVWGASTTLE
jgi:D-glycero-D-manno-heptose 1,7-bisphosphate phosphatase